MNLRRQYVQARTALDVGSRKKPYLWIHYFDQVALPYIIEQATKRLPANMFCHKGLLRLKEQDEKNHTEYMLTLKTYLDQHLNATQTAKELFIHRSTFRLQICLAAVFHFLPFILSSCYSLAPISGRYQLSNMF